MAGRPFVLYWSSLEKYEGCNRKFLWYRGWKGIDLGRGDGRGKKIPIESSEHHRMMGDVIQRVVEEFYNEHLWRTFRGKALRHKMEELTRYYFDKKLKKSYIDWGPGFRQAKNPEELLQICLDGVRGYLKTLRHNYLLGGFSRAEVDLKTAIEAGVLIGGRADLIIRRPKDHKILPGISILDGKNSKHKGRYTSPDQVRWYALCFYLVHGVMPERVGFTYYRYPYGTPIEGGEPGEIEQGVDWVDFTKEDLEGLAHRAVVAVKGMNRHEFDPDPKPPECRFCDFETVCPERQAQRAANAAKRKKKEGKLDADLAKGQESNESKLKGLIEF